MTTLFCSLLLLFILPLCNAESCLFIPDGSIVEYGRKNQTIQGNITCDYCTMEGDGSSIKWTCDGASGKYMQYNNNPNCQGAPSETLNVIIKGKCFEDLCIGYNSVMYNYTGTECQGNVMENITVYGQWILNQCIQVNSVDVTTETCEQGEPAAYIWHPPNLDCLGPGERITYNTCTPPYDGHTEKLTLLLNPCTNNTV